MLPHLANPAGLWVLTALPLLVAIHFLHRRPRERATATLFLLESLAPEDKGGRAWEYFRATRAFWLQLAAALLLAWVLAEPVWPRQGARVVAVFVLDESADMQPFRQEALQAVAADMSACTRQGLPVTWILLGSRPASRPFYRGSDARAALDAIERHWQPRAATHDPAPALSAASSLAGHSGMARLVTCRPDRVPPGQCARGVGRPLANLGFAGVTPMEEPGGGSWRIAVCNRTPATASPAVIVRTASGKEEPIAVPAIEPGGMAEFTYRLPPGCERAVLHLPPDPFEADNVLALQRVRPKRVNVLVEMDGRAASLPGKVAGSVPGLVLLRDPSTAPAPPSSASQAPTVTFTTHPTAPAPAVVMAPGAQTASSAAGPTSLAPVFAENHSLTEGLNWSGLLVPSPGPLAPGDKATMLLWLGSAPLAWLEEGRLFLNWRWQDSNAGHIPAPLLLMRRYLQSVQQAAPGTLMGNWPAGALLPLPGAGTFSLELPDGQRRTGACEGRLPEEAGFVAVDSLEPGRPPLLQGGVWWADARMGDFASCRAFETGLPVVGRDARRSMRPDPFAALWLCLAGLALLASWLPSRTSRLYRP